MAELLLLSYNGPYRVDRWPSYPGVISGCTSPFLKDLVPIAKEEVSRDLLNVSRRGFSYCLGGGA